MVNRTWAFALALALAGAPVSSLMAAASPSGGTTAGGGGPRAVSGRSHPSCGSGVNKAPLPKAATPPRSRTATPNSEQGTRQPVVISRKPVVRSN